MSLLTKFSGKPDELKPVRELPKPRLKCPFYGFYGAFRLGNWVMIDTDGGNACALTQKHSPCRMEMAHEPPNWNTCPTYNHPGNIADITQVVYRPIVFPREFMPVGAGTWKGMPVKEWVRYILEADI